MSKHLLFSCYHFYLDPSNTAASVQKEEGTFDWNVTQIKTKTTGTGEALTTDPITFYTVLNVPNDPWDPADTTSLAGYPYPAEDNKMQPWVSVLETLTSAAWCGGNTTVEQVAATVTTNLYEGGKFRYEPSGPPVYQVFTQAPYFNLTSFHNQIIGNGSATTVGCADMAWGVKVLSNLLGDDLKVMHIGYPIVPKNGYRPDGSYGIIGYQPSATFLTNQINPIGSTIGSPQWTTKTWGYHAVAWRGGNADTGTVYDACLRLYDGSTDGILACNMLFTTYRNMLTSESISRQGFNDNFHRLD